VVGDESGAFKKVDWMVVGMLFLSNPTQRRVELSTLRREKNYYRELKYESTDKSRVPYAMAVLAWFFETTDLEFRCIAKSGDEFDLSYYDHKWRGLNASILAYNYTYKELLKHNLPADPHRLSIKLDRKSRHRSDNLLDYLKEGIPEVRLVREEDSKADDLLQVIDLLVGCEHGDILGQQEPLKRALSDAFLRGCGAKSVLRPPTACTRSKVNVWYWNSAYARKRAADRS
jgi:hypothetical protein